jgi:lipoyl(octanoyl) transferase
MNRLRCNLYDLSASGKFVNYETVWRYQKALQEQASQEFKHHKTSIDSIVLVQHPSVYTLGRGATPDNIKFHVGDGCRHQVFRVERGGEVTWHGPGQLVAYPILNLNNHRKDLHW